MPSFRWSRQTLGLFVLVTVAAVAWPHCRLSGRASAASPVRLAYYVTYDDRSFASLQGHVAEIDALSPGWYRMDGSGNLSLVADKHFAEIKALTGASGVKLLPLVQCAEQGAAFHNTLADAPTRASAVASIRAAVSANGYDGIQIDFEGVDAADRPHLTAFMAELCGALHADGKIVCQAVDAKTEERFTGWTGAFDYAALGQHNDYIVLMAYGYGTSKPQSTSPYAWVSGSAAYAASCIPPSKVLIGIAWYGYDWDLSTPAARPVALTAPDAMALASSHGATITRDEATKSCMFRYSDGGSTHEVWLEDAGSARTKIAVGLDLGFAGWAGWRLGHEDAAFWQDAAPTPSPTPLPPTATAVPPTPVPDTPTPEPTYAPATASAPDTPTVELSTPTPSPSPTPSAEPASDPCHAAVPSADDDPFCRYVDSGPFAGLVARGSLGPQL